MKAPHCLRIGLVTDYIGNAGGGVGEVVRNLAVALSSMSDCTVVVLARDAWQATDALRDRPLIAPRGFRVVGPAKLGLSPDLARLLCHHELDLVHLHGLWTLSMHAVSVWSKRSGHRPYMVSPHGMLDSWALANSYWRKRAAAWVYGDACLAGAAALHALCPPEADACRRYGLHNTIRTVPNGVWLPSVQPSGSDGDGHRGDGLDTRRVVLYLGRLDPKKNLLALLQAWRQLMSGESPGLHQQWRLRLVGWGPAGYIAELKWFVERHQLRGTIEILGPAFGLEKVAAFRQADLFVMPSLSEGLPIAVLEAWSYGLPAVLSEQCNLDVGFRCGAALPCGTDWRSIRDTLRDALRMPHSALRVLGEKGRVLVEQQFTWDVVAAQFMEIYADLTGRHA